METYRPNAISSAMSKSILVRKDNPAGWVNYLNNNLPGSLVDHNIMMMNNNTISAIRFTCISCERWFWCKLLDSIGKRRCVML
ncbi:hypothetical protein NMYAN_40091 [Nitrosomonas nitrosa]|uniref:Uncharacterized protein n=1 Tax=Nitrosomonas nitrosa TaxID=52442 RepID=A0A8H9D9S2_9PROT|nr:hypothetical protein NMYAN_40091 [Nitrosomonas nitrosa]